MYRSEHTALARIVEYLYEGEKRHYEESGKPARHIFRDVLVLDEVLGEEAKMGLAEDDEEPVE
jgi:hypothetical protein